MFGIEGNRVSLLKQVEEIFAKGKQLCIVLLSHVRQDWHSVLWLESVRESRVVYEDNLLEASVDDAQVLDVHAAVGLEALFSE